MTLVIADCVPRKTPWPRGLLLGLAIALKLTPAVFLLYFLLRRDTRAAGRPPWPRRWSPRWSGSRSPGATRWEYWTDTVRNTDRIGTATLNTNQNIAGALARLGLGEGAAVRAVDAGLLRGARRDGLGGARAVLRAGRAGAGADLRRAVRAGGVAGVVVAPLGVGAADGAGDRGAGLPARQRRAGRGHRRRGGADGVDADRPAARAPRDDGVAVASAAGVSYVWWALAVIVVAGDGVAPGQRRTRRRGGPRRRAGCRASAATAASSLRRRCRCPP